MTKEKLTSAEQLLAAIRDQAVSRADAQAKIAQRQKPAARPTRYLHVSKVYPPNPNYGKALPNGALDTAPYLALPGRTFNVGRNAAKRAKRAESRRSRA